MRGRASVSNPNPRRNRPGYEERLQQRKAQEYKRRGGRMRRTKIRPNGKCRSIRGSRVASKLNGLNT